MGIEKDEGKIREKRKIFCLDGGENIGDFVGLGWVNRNPNSPIRETTGEKMEEEKSRCKNTKTTLTPST